MLEKAGDNFTRSTSWE